MQCEEELEVYENGFEDGRFNLRVEYYGTDARKILLAIIYELYLPDYGKEYVYPFECAKEFWGIPMEGEEVKGEGVEGGGAEGGGEVEGGGEAEAGGEESPPSEGAEEAPAQNEGN